MSNFDISAEFRIGEKRKRGVSNDNGSNKKFNIYIFFFRLKQK